MRYGTAPYIRAMHPTEPVAILLEDGWHRIKAGTFGSDSSIMTFVSKYGSQHNSPDEVVVVDIEDVKALRFSLEGKS